MKRHGTYTEIFRNDRWAIFKAQGGLNQVLAKNTITTETHAFARSKALGCCDTLAVGRTVPCAY
jgi:hypothetical protein